MKNHSVACSLIVAGVALFGGRQTMLPPPSWELSSRHILHGVPQPVDDRYVLGGTDTPSLSLLGREGFVVGYSNRYRIALFVSMQWTRELYEASKAAPGGGREYRPDPDLPPEVRATPDFEFSSTKLERGHLARHLDNKAWGDDNAQMGNLVSNLAPMTSSLNGGSWARLENAHWSIVTNRAVGDTIWVICGAVIPKDTKLRFLRNGVVVPEAYYKIIAWEKSGRLETRAYLFPQSADKEPPEQFLTTVDEIESLTGLDFFPKLPDGLEAKIESAQHSTMWPAR